MIVFFPRVHAEFSLECKQKLAVSALPSEESISVALSSYGLQAEQPPLTYRMHLS